MPECRICSNTQGNVLHRFREMMFGTRDEFEYIECSKCGTIQIAELPDFEKYYPDDYYSFSAQGVTFADKWTTRFVARSAAKHLIGQDNFFGSIFSELKPWTKENFPAYLRNKKLGLRLDSAILDVGCGSGQLLDVLSSYGFTNLAGADLFIANDLRTPAGVPIYKLSLEEIEQKFDLIMFNHSFEHVADPISTLQTVRDRLSSKGLCLIRMPVAAEAWKIYGRDWVQLDPPRHTFIFTEHGFKELAKSLDLSLVDVMYDSNAFQFWGSEVYRRDTPLQEVLGVGPSSYFGPSELEAWERQAATLNELEMGDQACFFLTSKDANER